MTIFAAWKKDHATRRTPRPRSDHTARLFKQARCLFISGQIPLNPHTGNVEATDIAGETHQVMHNLEAILSAAGLDFNHVVKTTILLSDMSLFATVNEIYGEYFTGDFPARETYAVRDFQRM